MKIRTSLLNFDFEWLFVLVVFVTFFSPTVLKLLEAFYMCYMFIFFHELSHMFVAAILGKKIDTLRFMLAGVCVSFKSEYNNNKTKEKTKNIVIYLAGPCSNLLLAYIFNKVPMIFEINIFLAILNFFPIFPLDGYKILKEIFAIFNIKNKRKIMDVISCFFLFAIFSISAVQIMFFKTPTMLIFSIYLLILKYSQNTCFCMDDIMSKIVD